MEGKILNLTSKKDGISVKILVEQSKEVLLWTNSQTIYVWDDEIKHQIEQRSGPSWLHPNIRVRIVSKSFRNGEFYNEKCVIQDVTSLGKCIVRTKKGVVLDDVIDRYLETVIPSVGRNVQVVWFSKDPSLVGQIGKLLEYNSSSQTCLVQLESTFEMEVYI